MQLTCPQCGHPVPTDHINIQQMAAACPACGDVFQFTLAKPKLKRRKARQPRHLQVREAEDLHIAYRNLFRLDKDDNFIASLTSSAVLTLATLITTGSYLAGEMRFILPLILGLATLPMYYWLGLIVLNKTHIDMDGASIKVSRQPLPHIGQTRQIDLLDVISVSTEETKASKQEEYDTPRYHVWANRSDSGRKIIASDVTEDYAYFIMQKLDEYLQRGADVDPSRLAMDEHRAQHDRAFIAEADAARESESDR